MNINKYSFKVIDIRLQKTLEIFKFLQITNNIIYCEYR
jgi:hypothetical protein